MTRYGIAIVGIAVICCAIGLIEGRWIYAMAIAVEAVVIVLSDIMSCRVDAKKDLREVYPPKRDRFHRDLKRLNKLRDTSPMVLPRRRAKKWLMSGNPATPDDYAMAIVFIVVLTALGLWMASLL